MTPLVKRNRAGISIIELMIYLGLASWITYAVATYMRVPSHVGSLMNAFTSEQAAYQLSDIPIDDLRSALLSSMPWGTALSTSSAQFDPRSLSWIKVHNPTVPNPFSWVCYQYRSGSLIRAFILDVNNAPTDPTVCDLSDPHITATQVIATHVIEPTIHDPLFVQDTSTQYTVILRVSIVGPQNTPLLIVRRAHVRA